MGQNLLTNKVGGVLFGSESAVQKSRGVLWDPLKPGLGSPTSGVADSPIIFLSPFMGFLSPFTLNRSYFSVFSPTFHYTKMTKCVGWKFISLYLPSAFFISPCILWVKRTKLKVLLSPSRFFLSPPYLPLISLYLPSGCLPLSPPYLPLSPFISLYLPLSPFISPYLPLSPFISLRNVFCKKAIFVYLLAHYFAYLVQFSILLTDNKAREN